MAKTTCLRYKYLINTIIRNLYESFDHLPELIKALKKEGVIVQNEFIFVYGTLRKETATHMYHVLARHCEYHSDGTMQGKLYEVDGYPGVIESNDFDDVVHGEIYRIVSPNKVLPLLDEYEECTEKFPQPHEYLRKRIWISLAGGESLLAWVYIYTLDVTELFQIKSGNYISYLNKMRK